MLNGTKRERKELKRWTDLSDLCDIHSKGKCFVVGAGPSVGFLDLKGIHEHIVISVNSSILLMNWNYSGDETRRFWVSNDRLVLRWNYFWSYVLRAYCTKLVRTSWRKYDGQIKAHNFRYFAPRESEYAPLYRDIGGLCHSSSVPTAIDLALLMGCKKIYLLGVDQKMIHGNSHFWQFWDDSKQPIRSDKGKGFRPEQSHQIEVFENNIKVFEGLKEYAERTGVSIRNCSLRSGLKVFDKLPFEKAL